MHCIDVIFDSFNIVRFRIHYFEFYINTFDNISTHCIKREAVSYIERKQLGGASKINPFHHPIRMS